MEERACGGGNQTVLGEQAYFQLNVQRPVLYDPDEGNNRDFSLTLSFGSQIASGRKRTNLSTMMPARMACATLLNFGLSDGRRLIVDIDRVNVMASQSRTSFGTESGSISDRAPSSSSINRLERRTGSNVD